MPHQIDYDDITGTDGSVAVAGAPEPMHPIGTRVGVCGSSDPVAKTWIELGDGVVEGADVPSADACGVASGVARASGRAVTRIRLDDGSICWACEVFTGPLAHLERCRTDWTADGQRPIPTTLDAWRRQVAAMVAA